MTDATYAIPKLDFIFHPSVQRFDVPAQALLSSRKQAQPDLHYGYIAVGALVLDDASTPRILLIQRAATDSMPNLWEIPGGGCDDDDPTILHSVARELWEEAGLTASMIGPRVGADHIFTTSSGKVVCKLNFLIQARKGAKVKLDPNEHQNYAWATEKEVKSYRSGSTELIFTKREQEAVILETFELMKTMRIAEGVAHG